MTIDGGLADLIVPHWSDGAGPRIGLSGSGADVQYGQGTVVSWGFDEAGVFHNVIRIDGTEIPDVPLMGSSDIFVIVPGDRVAVMYWTPSGGAGVYWITGRIVVPGTDAAARSIEFMRGQLAKQIAAEIFAERLHSDRDDGIGTRSPDEAWGDLTGAAVGPVVTADVSDAGTAIVFISATLNSSAVPTANVSVGTYVSVAVSGATTRDPDGFSALRNDMSGSSSAGNQYIRATAIGVFDDLNAGEHTFTMKYQAAGDGVDGIFSNRTLAVIAL